MVLYSVADPAIIGQKPTFVCCVVTGETGVKCTPTRNGLLTVLGITAERRELCLFNLGKDEAKSFLSMPGLLSKEGPMFCTFARNDVIVGLRPRTPKS